MTPAQRAAQRMADILLLWPAHDAATAADRDTALADARAAVCLARGVPAADVDPGAGYDVSYRAYTACRASWRHHISQRGLDEFSRRDLAAAIALWAACRPEYLTGDDWLTGIATEGGSQ